MKTLFYSIISSFVACLFCLYGMTNLKGIFQAISETSLYAICLIWIGTFLTIIVRQIIKKVNTDY